MGERSGIGFTGTRKINSNQRAVLGKIADALLVSGFVDNSLSHGNCRGADEAMHFAIMCLVYPWHVKIHPGPESQWDAGQLPCATPHALTSCERRPYLERNKAIIDASQLCLAVVDGPERKRSGTWSTVRYARKTGTPVVILWPDTAVTVEAPGHGWFAHVIKDALERAGFEMGARQ